MMSASMKRSIAPALRVRPAAWATTRSPPAVDPRGTFGLLRPRRDASPRKPVSGLLHSVATLRVCGCAGALCPGGPVACRKAPISGVNGKETIMAEKTPETARPAYDHREIARLNDWLREHITGPGNNRVVMTAGMPASQRGVATPAAPVQ